MNPVLAFFLGFLLAFIIIGGVVAGVVAYFLNYKIDKISGNKDVDGNYVYINGNSETGGASTVLGIVKKIAALTKDFSSRTVGEVASILPVVNKLVDKLEVALSAYVDLEENELQSVKFGELNDYITGIKGRIDVARMVGVKPDNAILCYLGYGLTKVSHNEETGEYTAKYKDSEGVVHDCVVEVENGTIKGAHYEGTNGEQTETVHLTFGNTSARVDGVTNELTISDVVEIEENDKLLGSVKNSTIKSLSSDIGKLSVQQLFVDDIYCIDSSDSGKGYKAPMYLAVDPDAASFTQVAAWEDKNLIYYVKNDDGTYSLAGSSGKLKNTEYAKDKEGNVTTNLVANCYDPSQTYYTLGENKILYDPGFVYYTANEDGSYTMLDAGGESAGRLPSFEADRYTYGAPSALWKLLLYDETSESTEENKVKEEKVYAVNNISVMINNVSKNTQNTSMRELDAAGILTFSNKEDLNTTVKWDDTEGSHQKILGDMELTEVVGVFVLFANTLNAAP